MAIDKLSADNEDLGVGDSITVAGAEAAREYEIVGIATLGEVDSFGGATVAILPLEEAQRLADKEGEFDQISIAAEEGVAPEAAEAARRAGDAERRSRCAPARRTPSSRPRTSRTTSAS